MINPVSTNGAGGFGFGFAQTPIGTDDDDYAPVDAFPKEDSVEVVETAEDEEQPEEEVQVPQQPTVFSVGGRVPIIILRGGSSTRQGGAYAYMSSMYYIQMSIV